MGKMFEIGTSPAFARFAPPVAMPTPLRSAISNAYRLAEAEAVAPLIEAARLTAPQSAAVARIAGTIVGKLRRTGQPGGVDGLMKEYSLSTQEGVALMCLAEALLRIPDSATRDRLIRDKIARGKWRDHLGDGRSIFVNAATWGLVVSGSFVAPLRERGLSASLAGLIKRAGEPVVRSAVNMAMEMMGDQFVTGETIGKALQRARKQEKRGFTYSYDMLGEAAMTMRDADRYYADYERAIHAIGKASSGRGVYAGPGISIKLSALHPRYARAQADRVMGELLPRVRSLAALASAYDIGFNIDAEESDRLEISLDILEALAFDPALFGWNGLGFVAQAYGKRCPHVIDWIVDLGERSGHRIMVRLVKGAYWDSEIKRAQVDGLADFPVFTRKVHTDVSYIACARKLLAARRHVFPQFATHNAQTLATIYHLAGDEWLGRVVDGLGRPMDDKGPLPVGPEARLFKADPPAAANRTRVGRRLETGVRSLDLFAPLCRGQRLGLFAGSGVGKSTLLSMLARWVETDIAVIGLIGERGREVQEFIEDDLGPEGLARSVVVVATSDSPALMRRQAAWTTLAIAEHFRDAGRDVMCLMDSVTRFAMAQREIGLANGEPPATKGYTPTVFAELPRLLERAGPGGPGQGSITGLFSVLVDGDDHDEPIADAVRGILDGHIVMSRKIAERGRFPAIDILKSVSRMLPDCHAEEENRLRLAALRHLSNYADMEELVRLGAYKSGSDAEVDEAIRLAPAIEDLLKQRKDDRGSLAHSFARLAELMTETSQ